MTSDNVILSKLPKTWLIDIDGTIFVHNGHLCGKDTIIEKTKLFMQKIPQNDVVILLTSRNERYRNITEQSLRKYGIRYDSLIFDLPCGERIVINDRKNSGLNMAYAINVNRDFGIDMNIVIDEDK